MMKKVFALLLALCMLAALAACSGNAGQPSNSPSAGQPENSPSASVPDNSPEQPSGSAEPSQPAEGGDVDLQKFYESLLVTDPESADYFNPEVRVEGDALTAYFPGLADIATKQLVIYQPMMSAVACEIALVEVENADDVQKVKDIFQARIDAQVGTDDEPGGAWYPESIEGWKNNSRIVDHGNYVMMAVWETADQFVEKFDALF